MQKVRVKSAKFIIRNNNHEALKSTNFVIETNDLDVIVTSNRAISYGLAKELVTYYFGTNIISLQYSDDKVYIDWSKANERRNLEFNYCGGCLTPISYGKHFDCEICDVITS